MRAAGLVIKEEPYTLTVPRSQRGGEVDRTDGLHPVVCADPAAGRAGPGSCARWAHPHRARALHQGVLQLVGKYPGLVHLAPALVGAPHPGLVLRRLRRDDRQPARTPAPAHTAGVRTCTRTRMCSTPGSPPGCGPSPRWVGPRKPPTTRYFYPTTDHGDRLRHPVLLGGAHDHVRTGVHRRDPLPYGIPARPDPR